MPCAVKGGNKKIILHAAAGESIIDGWGDSVAAEPALHRLYRSWVTGFPVKTQGVDCMTGIF
jgi:hypothetical protein